MLTKLFNLGGYYIPSLNLVEWNHSIFNNVVGNVLNKVVLSYAAGIICYY